MIRPDCRASKVYVAECRFGKGLFATSDIQPGETFLEFTGQAIDIHQALSKGDRSGDPLQINVSQYLDLDEPGLYVNHSCDPNSGVIANTRLIALRPIRQDEEVCYDYSTTMADRVWTMQCDCRTPMCRGVVDDFRTLPSPIQRKYLDMCVVQAFIVDECRQTF